MPVKSFFASCTLSLICVTAPLRAADGPDAAVEQGRLHGAVDGDVIAFRGIPFAAAPIGPLRWKPPIPAATWPGVRDATQFGAECLQQKPSAAARQSEDCLFLNVWRPTKPGRYPVMVFIHGGSFTNGAGSRPLYDGANFARHGVVLVTINYRLGKFGFFAHPALTRESPAGPLANYGVMDQIAALRWVRRNVAQFDGDVGNITLFGESAGAGSVLLLMASPDAKGLFNKAVVESGAGGVGLPSIGAAEAAGVQWIERMGVRDATVAQLRSLPADKLIDRGFPIVDGKVVVASAALPFYQHRAMKIPLIVGANSNESTLARNNDTASQALLGDRYPALLKAYEAARPGLPLERVRTDLAEDALSVLPSHTIASLQAATGAPAYSYYFDQTPVSRRAGSKGTPHAGELAYLFGNPPEGVHWDAADQDVSDKTMGYWVRFAATGNPNGAGAPAWPEVGTGVPHYLAIGSPTRARTLTPVEEELRKLVLERSAPRWERSADVTNAPEDRGDE